MHWPKIVTENWVIEAPSVWTILAYRISSYSFRPWIVSAHLFTVTFGLMYCDFGISKSKKNSFPKLYEEIRYLICTIVVQMNPVGLFLINSGGFLDLMDFSDSLDFSYLPKFPDLLEVLDSSPEPQNSQNSRNSCTYVPEILDFPYPSDISCKKCLISWIIAAILIFES